MKIKFDKLVEMQEPSYKVHRNLKTLGENQTANYAGILPLFSVLMLLSFLFFSQSLVAAQVSSETVYKNLSSLVKENNSEMIQRINQESRNLNWQDAKSSQFKGNLRYLASANQKGMPDQSQLFLVRRADGEIFILSIPEQISPDYQDLTSMLESKLEFSIKSQLLTIEGNSYQVAQFVERPKQPFLDKIFRIMIILMLFLVMVGMGMTLAVKDFTVLITKPKAIITGAVLQFGIMPLVAVALGHMMGFYDAYPYIFVGMVLVTVTPGGVTSNLMTHYAKGDVALSVSLTSVSTVASIIFLPLLLHTYCANIPDIEFPTKIIALTIIALVILPLVIGMLVRKFNEGLAVRLTPIFSALGIVAVLFLMVAGVLSNKEGFADTERYGFMFYTMVFLLTLLGMIVGGIVPKLLKISNYQIRAISMETGLRNSSLAMTIAILIQDPMGDFYSSMFWVSGMFGLTMYLAGLIAIKVYPTLFPLVEVSTSNFRVTGKINNTN
jgi:BASS family bile acid:Na+ symporter